MKYISILILLLIFSCQEKEDLPTEIDKTIVLCFDHYAPPYYKSPGAGFSHLPIPLVAYIDSTKTYIEYTPKIDFDTITIYSPKEFQELALSYRNFEYAYYPLLQGDTIIISMDSLNYPLLKSKHYPERNRIYNMNYEIRKKHLHSGLEAKTCLGSDWAIIAQKIDYIRTQEWGGKYLIDYCSIDSLSAMFENYKRIYMDTINLYKQQKIISNTIYDHYKYLLQLKEYESQRILNKDTAYYRQMEVEIRDKYVCYPSYREFLGYYLGYYNMHIKISRKFQGRNYDWRKTFDELALKPFQSISKQILLGHCVKEIGKYSSVEDLKMYLDRYLKLTHDTLLYESIRKQYNLSADANQLLLKNTKGESISLQQLLNQNKGKVIYMDFWASWCVPCREEMAISAKLRELYEGEDVVFIYLAYKDTEENWKKAIMQQNLSNASTSYFIENSSTSNFLKKMKLESIPRYIIFNKAGKLVEINAPRPSDQRITIILNKYLYESTSENNKR